MKPNVQQSRPRFFWQGALILLPIAVLAVLGVSSLRRDRSLVEQEARENARVLAGQIADYISPRLDARVWGQYHWAIQARERNPPPATQMSQTSRYSDGPDKEIVEEFNIPMPQYRRLLAGITNHGHGALEASGWTPRMIVNPNGNLLWPPPYPLAPSPAFPDGASLTPEQSQLVEAARVATGSNALVALESLLSASPPPQLAGHARLELSRCLAVAGKTNEAFSSLAEIATASSALTSEAGIPLQPLACLARLRLLNQGDLQAIHEAASQLASNAVTWPSLLTPAFLEEAVRAWPGPRDNGQESDPVSWRKRWWVQEDARSLHAHLLASGVLPVANQKRASFWTSWRNESWLLLPSSEVTFTNEDGSLNTGVGFQVFPEVVVEMGLLELLDQSKLRVPNYAEVSFEASHRTWPTNASGAVLAEAPMTWDHRGSMLFSGRYQCQYVSLPGLLVRIRLAKPESLFALQRQRAMLFGGLIGAAALASLAGVFVAHRAFHRQLQLNEAKSNFVSSVSHELRAPIASVRLLAESLERGKVENAGKQREYFGFIVQECRRLSSLIENVLDFSRIEEGRKQYDFEPTDLGTLVEQTVKLMEPYAAEKGVRLELGTFNIQHSTSNIQPGANATAETSNLEPRTLNLELLADGKAIQQALVNLIDNAIKHSPKGGAVTVGLEVRNAECGVRSDLTPGGESPTALNSQPSTLNLFVEDHGPGIPPEEHARIFERFYRRGSELRRETQGVGIGLSIVKHIVEAHGGRVLVRSAVGEGSRFTIELPLQK